MPGLGKHLYAFDRFVLDPEERRLLRDGEAVALTPKCFDLLVVLVQNSGHLLAKSDLLERVWPGQFVEEGNLSFNISELRKALGEREDGQQYIETVRKKGFRFVANVEERMGSGVAVAVRPPPAPRSRRRAVVAIVLAAAALVALVAYLARRRGAVPPPGERPRTLAVLPFKPLAANARDEPLEMGICNSLVTRLSSIDELVVRPTSAVVEYNRMGQDPLAAGRALGVDVLLDGYIQRSQAKIRVTVRLLRTADGKSLWSGEFNESFTDIFAVEDSISRQIVEALNLKLSGAEQRAVTKHGTESVEAYELYVKGLYLQEKRTPAEIEKSIDYFRAATAKDPRYALAFAAIANSYVILAVRADMRPRDSYANAKTAAMRAVQLDDRTAEAHSSLGYVKAWYDWDFAGAEREFRRAFELSANAPMTYQQYASFLLSAGRLDEAVSQITRAQHLDPVSLPTEVQAARIYFFKHDYDRATAECRKIIDVDPEFAGAHQFLGRIYAQQRLYPQALRELERARSRVDNAEVLSLIGYTYAVSGRRNEATAVLDELRTWSARKYVSPYHFALVYAGLGASADAFQWLEKAYEEREGRLTILGDAPEFSSLRPDPRFQDLVRRIRSSN